LFRSGGSISNFKARADGEQAVQLVGRLKPDLVLMDIEMPQMNGLEATRRIKTQNRDTRVVLLSALDDEAHRKGAADCGADGFLPKTGEVRAVIGELVVQSRKRTKAA
jgi:DNA-binding NarL/FixJ family response regulator